MSTKIMEQVRDPLSRCEPTSSNPKVPESVLAMIPLYITEGALEGVRGNIFAFAYSCL